MNMQARPGNREKYVRRRLGQSSKSLSAFYTWCKADLKGILFKWDEKNNVFGGPLSVFTVLWTHFARMLGQHHKLSRLSYFWMLNCGQMRVKRKFA